MLYWVLTLNGVLSAILTLLIALRFLGRPLKPSPVVCAAGSIAGFCAWTAWLLSSGQVTSGEGGIASLIWQQWIWLAPFLVALEAGFLGWYAVRSFWRWFLLAAGPGILLLLVLLALLVRWLHP